MKWNAIFLGCLAVLQVQTVGAQEAGPDNPYEGTDGLDEITAPTPEEEARDRASRTRELERQQNPELDRQRRDQQGRRVGRSFPTRRTGEIAPAGDGIAAHQRIGSRHAVERLHARPGLESGMTERPDAVARTENSCESGARSVLCNIGLLEKRNCYGLPPIPERDRLSDAERQAFADWMRIRSSEQSYNGRAIRNAHSVSENLKSIRRHATGAAQAIAGARRYTMASNDGARPIGAVAGQFVELFVKMQELGRAGGVLDRDQASLGGSTNPQIAQTKAALLRVAVVMSTSRGSLLPHGQAHEACFRLNMEMASRGLGTAPSTQPASQPSAAAVR